VYKGGSNFNIDPGKLVRVDSTSEPVPALENEMGNTLFWESSRGANTWNASADDDDLVNLVHLYLNNTTKICLR